MKFQTINTKEVAVSITTAAASPWHNIGEFGCDSIAFVLVVTGASSPNTATIQIEASMDKVNTFTVGSTVSVTGNGVFTLEKDRPAFHYYRVKYAIVSGSYTANLTSYGKSDKAD